ncbi:reverse transcriptase domain protein [Colletotrichum karsti]|uniref:Reverse transcriptase domain protein n=1 Tax=Colletotrichum karsti TaxID=1095194 RepID=A0A9P6HVW5_9PEZI|nr:reverse transcriptase domain protein [Colletotrichum karsti]KAF9871344.1 reverse transcriptase domain protein [Colletotrichum karsti]
METYASTLAGRSFRSLMAIVARFDLETLQLDAVNAFTNATLDETVYVWFPPGFSRPGYCLILRKALYGLRRSPLLWQKSIDTTLKSLGLAPLDEDDCVYVGKGITVFIFVDDIAIIYRKRHMHTAKDIVSGLKAAYEMKELGELNVFLGIRIIRDRKERKLWLSLDNYISKICDDFQGKLHRCIKQADGQPLELSFAYTCKTVAAEMKLLTLGVNTITFSTFFSDDLCFLAGTFSKLRTDFLDNLRSTIFHYSGDSMIGRVYSELAATYPQFVPVLDHIKKVTNRKDPHNIPDNYGEALSSYREFVKHALQLASTHYKGARPEDIRRIDPLRIVHCSVQPWDIPSYDNVMELASYFNPSRSAEQLAKFLGDSRIPFFALNVESTYGGMYSSRIKELKTLTLESLTRSSARETRISVWDPDK